LAQQKQEECIRQLASKVDVLTTHNRILEAQIAQQASTSSTPTGKLLSKPESNPCEHFTCVILKEGVEDPRHPEDILLAEGREIIMVESKERNDDGKPMNFIENDSLEIPIVFPPKLPDPSNFSIPYTMGKMKIERALCDLGAVVSLIPYSLFHKLHLGPL